MVRVHPEQAPPEVANRRPQSPFQLDPVLELPDHKSCEKNKPFRARNETERLVRNDVRLGRQMREGHPQQKKSPQDVKLDQTRRRRLFPNCDRLWHGRNLHQKLKALKEIKRALWAAADRALYTATGIPSGHAIHRKTACFPPARSGTARSPTVRLNRTNFLQNHEFRNPLLSELDRCSRSSLWWACKSMVAKQSALTIMNFAGI